MGIFLRCTHMYLQDPRQRSSTTSASGTALHLDTKRTSTHPNPSNLPFTMCNYWSMEPLCGHRSLLAASNCYLLYDQLQRINDPTELSRHGLPFDMPHECLPSRRNIRRKYVNDYCSFECRNNGMYGGSRCGTRDARYGPGSERVGVGWR